MGYDPGLVARVADVLEQLGVRGVRQKGIFGGRGFLRGGRTLLVVEDDGLLLKLTGDAHRIALTEPGVAPFAVAGERPSRSWITVSAEAIADDAQLREWLQRALG
jgi:TfoX/Sxy family transcriptional regulator of competence genes